MTTTDEKEIQELFTQFLEGWNAGSGAAFAAPFTETLDFVAFDGTHFTDRAVLAAFNQDLFDKWLRGSRLTGTASVRMVTPDTAVVLATGGTIMRGKTKPSRVRDSIQTLTAVRTPDGWRFTSFQNTRLRPMTANRRHLLLWLATDLLWRFAGKGRTT